jgi:hypothetical protein
LDAVLHAEHKETLEEMRAYYMLQAEDDKSDQTSPDSGGDQAAAAVNGKGSGLFGMDDDGASSFLSRSLDWRTLLGLSPDPVTPAR